MYRRLCKLVHVQCRACVMLSAWIVLLCNYVCSTSGSYHQYYYHHNDSSGHWKVNIIAVFRVELWEKCLHYTMISRSKTESLVILTHLCIYFQQDHTISALSSSDVCGFIFCHQGFEGEGERDNVGHALYGTSGSTTTGHCVGGRLLCGRRRRRAV